MSDLASCIHMDDADARHRAFGVVDPFVVARQRSGPSQSHKDILTIG